MWALLSLAIGSFGIGMTEFVVMGLLPDIAQDLLPAQWSTNPENAIAQAGWLISLYALGVVVGAPTIAGVVAKYPRHRVCHSGRHLPPAAHHDACPLAYCADDFELLSGQCVLNVSWPRAAGDRRGQAG